MIFIPIGFALLGIDINGKWLLLATISYMIIQDIFYYPDLKKSGINLFFAVVVALSIFLKGKY